MKLRRRWPAIRRALRAVLRYLAAGLIWSGFSFFTAPAELALLWSGASPSGSDQGRTARGGEGPPEPPGVPRAQLLSPAEQECWAELVRRLR